MTNAQLVQSINNNYEKSYKKANEIVVVGNTTYFNKYHQLLKIEDSKIDPSAAFRFQKTCIDSIKKLEKIQDNLINIGKKDTLKKNVHSDNYINKKSIELSDKIKAYKEAKDYYGAINSIEGSPKLSRRVFPIRSIAQAQKFYLDTINGESRVSYIKDVSYQNNLDGSNTLSSSIFTGIVPLWKMPLKINFATTITQNNDTVVQRKVADKVSKGGLFNVGVTYTLLYSNWKYLDNNSVIIYMPIETKFHIDDVKNKSNIKDSFNYLELSSSLLVSFDLLKGVKEKNEAKLFVVGKYSYYNGGNKFSENLNDNKFSFFQLNTGIKIANKFTISINMPIGSSSKSFLDSQTTTLGLVFDTGN